jgi:3-oxoacyl-[acyl-carrier-protein] synthase-3
VPEPALRPVPMSLPPAGRLGTAVAGLGVAVPETAVANAPIAARLGVEEDWIVQRTGIDERRVAAPGERLADYAALAGRRALASAAAEPAELDLLLVATISNEDLTPAAAPQVAAALGASEAAALDVGAACTGFIAALALACAQIESGRATNALVIGADLMSRLTDPDDRTTAALFGDGAGAVLLRAAAPGRIGPVVLKADGANAGLVRASREEGVLRMDGHETFRHAVARMCEVSVAATAAAGRHLPDLDLFVYHQANARILRAIAERLQLPADRVVDCIGRYGNTSAASIPLALDAARAAGTLSEGSRVLLAAFGAGLAWGAVVLEWGENDG